MKSHLFVGSSVESLSVAYAVQENLEHDAEVTVWPEGIFEPSKTTLQQLLAVFDGFDFAVFVFAKDDVAIVRDREQPVTRDNVIFELGLFAARLGSERCFLLTPRTAPDLHLPSDVLGLSPANYDDDRQDKNLVAGLGTACNRIRRVIQRMGPIASQVQAKAAVAQLAAGITEEVREDLKEAMASASKQSRSSRTEQSYRQLQETLEAAVSVQPDAGAARPSGRVLSHVAGLNLLALALVRAIQRRHLTRRQYQKLRSNAVARNGLLDLRRAGLLVPLAGWENKKRVPVYWFPPNMATRIQAALTLAPISNAAVIKEVNAALEGVGYRSAAH
jgi:hypothetical protein